MGVNLHHVWLAASIDERATFADNRLADLGEALLLRAYRAGTVEGLRSLVPLVFELRRLGRRLEAVDHGPENCSRCGEPLSEDNTDLDHDTLCDHCGHMLAKELAA